MINQSRHKHVTNFLVQVYRIIYIAIMFCGNSFMLEWASTLMLCEVGILVAINFLSKSERVFVNTKSIYLACILIIFVIFLSVQILFAYNRAITMIYIKRYIIYALLLIFVADTAIQFQTIRFIKIYSLIAAISIIADTIISQEKAGGLLGNYQAAGMMMSLAALLFFMDYLYSNKKMDILGVLLSVIALLTSGKRMFSILVVIGIIFIYSLMRKNSSNKRYLKKRFWIVIIISAIALVIAVAKVPQVREVFTRFTELSGKDEDIVTSGRSVLWEKALVIFKKHKFIGIGFANFAVYFAAHYRIDGVNAYLTHNIYYGLLAETGIIGFSIMILFFTTAFVESLVIYNKIRKLDNMRCKYIMTYSLMIQLWFIIYGYSGNGIYDVNEFFFYIMAVAMMVSVKKEVIINQYKGCKK